MGMIVKAKHNFLLYSFFTGYARWKIKRNFTSVRIIGDVERSDLPVLLLSNHISWWDGFWAMYLNLNIFRRRFYFMMLEKELRKYWFFNYTGGFSVRKKSKSILETLTYTESLLGDKKNLVLIFPHGGIQSMHQQNFQFEKGVERIIRNLAGNIHIVFMASLVDYFSNSKPSVYIHIRGFSDNDFTIENIQGRYNEFYRQCVEKQTQIPDKT
jgi:1-acyl-sn-glycerol-3-phosphate acyltransferase